eukprot:CAMPEP_0114584580 /NCGR_PEP_ID=MMETSP0125-20121206/8251_1 /TAXON_ID=485358 ORGANISM="Aristerostoma sp., Strain ATCC 50986" /NCGR_SAMPLE_ID=MMETSP0125 /ASSEMBLY_ACC=CAM_ASM_000245 /LENGTH=68 /DNA_ID=CAMNT_0001779055 /DNA_START=1565 /DNA_END=1771 /DNA_ORIENTATION=-
MANKDVKDLDREHEYDKAELLDAIRMLERDIKMNNAIMVHLVSPEELDLIRSKTAWSESRNEFLVPRF